MPRLTPKQMIDALRAEKMRAMKRAIERASKTLDAGALYKKGTKHEEIYPKPKTPSDAKKYHDMRHEAAVFIQRSFDQSDVPGMPEADDPTIEELAQLSRGKLKAFLDKAIKAKKITKAEAEKIQANVSHHKDRAAKKAAEADGPSPI